MEEVTVSTGVVFNVRGIPATFFTAAIEKQQQDKPAVPIIHSKEKGRDEPNPNDPQYLEDLKLWEARYNARLLDAALVFGTEAATIPDGLPKPEDDVWLNKALATGLIDEPKNGEERYLLWIKFCAAPKLEDTNNLSLASMREFGVSEEDVADAAQSFRS